MLKHVASLVLLTSLCLAQEASQILFDMETVRHKPTEAADKSGKKGLCGTAELVDGKFGKAVLFKFNETAGPAFMVAPVRAGEEWNKSAGISFWVKGDGSANWGGLEMIDKSDYSLRYGYCFPIDSTDWKKIVVPWRDLIPELAGPLVDAKGGFAPSSFGNLWFGKWFYWREHPAHSYTIDQIALEMSIDVPPVPAPKEPGLARVLAKLKAKQAITIVTMGDSLTDKRHWANRELLWAELLTTQLKAKYGGEVKLGESRHRRHHTLAEPHPHASLARRSALA